MKKYKITGNVNIRHDGKLYEQGSMIELEKADADRLKGYLSSTKSKPKAPDGAGAGKETETETNKGEN